MAGQNDVQAREFSREERDRLAEEGKALPDGSFPIVTREDLENAIQAIGRAGDPAAAKRHIKKRARALGAEELIPEEWNALEAEIKAFQEQRITAKLRNGKRDWYRIENKAGLTEVFIYDEIGGFGITASDFTAELRDIKAEALTLHVNSPGGDVFDGLAIYQALRNHPAQVTVEVDSLAASIASVIAMGADKLVMAPRASLMIHDGFTMAIGNAAEMRKIADLLDRTSDNIASVYAEKAGGTVEFWRERMREETWYNAEEALEAGLVDEIQGKQKGGADEGFDLSLFAHAGRENAPTPVLIEAKAEVEEVTEEEKVEEPAFTWDFGAFQAALKEGIASV